MLARRLLSLCLPALAALSACTGASGTDEAAATAARADSLYRDLKGAYGVYTDSLRALPDSDTIDRATPMVQRFERRLYNIYRAYPADLDAALSETQNDSLWQAVERYIEARDRHRQTPDTASIINGQ